MLSFVAGGFAGLVAQTLTQPLHVVRRRMQVEVGRGPPRARVQWSLSRAVMRSQRRGRSGVVGVLPPGWDGMLRERR